MDNNNEYKKDEKFEAVLDSLFTRDADGKILDLKRPEPITGTKPFQVQTQKPAPQKSKSKLFSKWYKKKDIKENVKKEEELLRREYFFGMYSVHLLKFLEHEKLIQVNDTYNFHQYVMKHIINYNNNYETYKKATLELGDLNIDINLDFSKQVEEDTEEKTEG